MNYKLVFRLLGRLLLTEAALMLPSLGVSLIYGQGDTLAFLCAIAITAVVGALLSFLLKPEREDLTARDGMAVAGLSWVILSFFGALPFVLSGAIPHMVDAYFEAVSGFTTTGSTILTEIEHLPKGVLFWRSFTHWIGGMGVLVFTLAVLPRLSGRTSHLARAESPGPTFSKLLPKMSDTAKMLYLLYFALTTIEAVCLLLAGMNLYDALIHALSTAGTGGFSNYNASVGAFHSPLIEWIIGIFMMLFGINFAIYFHMLRREKEPILQNEELWTYLGIVLGATLLITLNILPRYDGFFEALRNAFFQVTSIVSTTGFGSADFNVWPLFSKTLLLLLLCLGACAGSTAGGFKLSRVLLLGKSAYRDLEHTIQPRKVAVVRLEGKAVQESTLAQVGVYLSLWVVLAVLGTLLLSLGQTDFVTAFTAVLTTLSNVGPGLNGVGPTENFAFFSPAAKLLLSFMMLAGRLEIYPILLLFAPHVWRKN
ncbi:MAG: TrkH family potassium uptake protein [Clostridia bacterium]|nr:TrkH family potassium uptake protein [Clostridia bacterium]MBR0406766.1 TrkH family potassium uptake protein [Clostridia bacterium]